jgi:AraC-like DNA-binding protein
MTGPTQKVIRTTVPAGSTSSITSGVLVALLDSLGHPPDELLAAAGLSRADLAGPEAVMPLDAFRELWARAHALVPDVGLSLVERFAPGQMHLLLHLAMRSATVGAALGDASRHASITSPADTMPFSQEGEVARFGYAHRGSGPSNPWLVEHYFGMVARFLAQATDRPLPIRAVSFIAPAQAPAAAYLARFGVAPHFEATANVIELDASALAWPLHTRDAYLHAILERVAQSRTALAPADDFVEAVRRAVAQAMLAGDAPTLETVATACRLGARTVSERLKKHGLGFRVVLDQVRRDLAQEHLARGLSVADTAALLGFSEPAAFQHACRRWFGESAGQLRKKLKK